MFIYIGTRTKTIWSFGGQHQILLYRKYKNFNLFVFKYFFAFYIFVKHLGEEKKETILFLAFFNYNLTLKIYKERNGQNCKPPKFRFYARKLKSYYISSTLFVFFLIIQLI